ncbi:MAG: DegT/DnrJ/EryC1/StrS family aminotransferase [Acidobacteriia bacterium]|nr:DegT/DnrJ/EryC1/StrS family aminotransferase [Terriglobia bacterium]
MKVPSVDLRAQYADIREEIQAALQEVLESQQFIFGPKVEQFEQEMARYCGTQYGVGVASGTDALLLSLKAVGVGPGDEVITSPFSFFATAGAIHNLGAVPVFVDIQPDTFNLNPELIEAKRTARTKALLPVHLFGQCADMKPVLDIARHHGLPVIEDAAQSIGAEYCLDGLWHKAGSLGDLGCISFFPSKNLGAFGDGGLVVTGRQELDDQVRLLRFHGGRTKYVHERVGYNSRLDALQAAVLSVKLKHLDRWVEARRAHAATYDRLLGASAWDSAVVPPLIRDYAKSVFNQYVIRCHRRDALKEFLEERGISTAVYYPVPLHLQPCFNDLGYKAGDLPVAEKACREVLALPIYPELTEEMQNYVVTQIRDFYRK